MNKTGFEEWLWDLACAEVKNTQSDNNVFPANVFHADCIEKHQSQSFSGIGTHHQMLVLSMPFRQLCTWHKPSCYMFHFIGLIMVLMIWHYSHLLSSILLVCTIGYLEEQ